MGLVRAVSLMALAILGSGQLAQSALAAANQKVAGEVVVGEQRMYRPALSSADTHDLSGVWNLRLRRRMIRTTHDEMPPFTPLGQAEWDRRHAAEIAGTPMADASAYCWPHGVPRLMNSPYPIQIIASPGEITVVHEVGHNIRHIYMDEPMPKEVAPSFLGTSVGHWEGDALVIETKGLDLRTWLDEEGVVHSKEMSVVERLRKVEGNTAIEDEFTITDPVFFTEPWVSRLVYDWAPTLRLSEYVCEENNRNRPRHGVTVAK